MSQAIKVAAVGQIEDGKAIVVDAAVTGTGKNIAVFRSGDEYFALDDSCSHVQAPLAGGKVEGGTVECPAHQARFDLRTGAALCLPAVLPVPTHAVEVRGDEIWLTPSV